MALLNTWAHSITVHRFSFPLRVAKILTRSKTITSQIATPNRSCKKMWSTTLSIEEKYLFSIIAKKNMRNGVEQSLILWPSAFHSDVVRSRWRRSVKRGMESYSQDIGIDCFGCVRLWSIIMSKSLALGTTAVSNTIDGVTELCVLTGYLVYRLTRTDANSLHACHGLPRFPGVRIMFEPVRRRSPRTNVSRNGPFALIAMQLVNPQVCGGRSSFSKSVYTQFQTFS